MQTDLFSTSTITSFLSWIVLSTPVGSPHALVDRQRALLAARHSSLHAKRRIDDGHVGWITSLPAPAGSPHRRLLRSSIASALY
jgi:hypothetical protein